MSGGRAGSSRAPSRVSRPTPWWTAAAGATLLTAAGIYGAPLVLGTSTAYWTAVLGGVFVSIGAWLLAARLERRATLVLVLAGAVLFRALLVPTTPELSDDLYRYLWDGRVQAAGVNPYENAPDDANVAALAVDGVSENINRPGVRTIYPGGAQLVFAASWRLGIRVPVAWKSAMAVVDVAAVVLMLLLLRRRERPARHALLYAWNPLPVLAFAHSGHLDVVVVALVVAAALAWESNRRLLVGLLLGAAAAVKLYPLVLLPAFLRRREAGLDPLVPLVAVAVPAVAYVAYLAAGTEVLGYLTSGYLEEEGYLSGERFYLARALHVPGVALGIVVLTAVTVAVLRSRRPAATRATWLLGAGLVLTTPYPWYATPLVALAIAAGPGLPLGTAAIELLWPVFAAGLEARYAGVVLDVHPSVATLRAFNVVLSGGVSLIVVLALVRRLRWRMLAGTGGRFP